MPVVERPVLGGSTNINRPVLYDRPVLEWPVEHRSVFIRFTLDDRLMGFERSVMCRRRIVEGPVFERSVWDEMAFVRPAVERPFLCGRWSALERLIYKRSFVVRGFDRYGSLLKTARRISGRGARLEIRLSLLLIDKMLLILVITKLLIV